MAGTGTSILPLRQYLTFVYVLIYAFTIPASTFCQQNRGKVDNFRLFNPTLTNSPGQFEPVSPNSFSKSAALNSYGVMSRVYNSNIIEPKRAMPYFTGSPSTVNQRADIERSLLEDKMYLSRIACLKKTRWYRQSFDELSSLNINTFSYTLTTYTIENTYYI